MSAIGAAESIEPTNDLPRTAPLKIGAVALKVRDPDTLSRYYQHVLGLHVLGSDANSVQLGTGGSLLVELISDLAAEPHDPRGAGLFHTAFLLPNRNALSAWTKHAVDNRFLITGASDHAISEAIYLSDPEGNGIEIYADRPQSEWRQSDGYFEMATDPLDVRGLMAIGPRDPADARATAVRRRSGCSPSRQVCRPRSARWRCWRRSRPSSC